MKRFGLFFLTSFLLMAVLCGCIAQEAGSGAAAGSAGVPQSAPVSSESPGAPTDDTAVPCPDHDPDMEVQNQNAAEPALLIAPNGEENLWIWTPSKTDDTLGTLVSTPVTPAVVHWSEEITAETKAPLWFAETALYQRGEQITLCCAALEDEQQAVLFCSEDGGKSWSEQRCSLPFSAAGAGCFLSAFGEGGMSAFVSCATPGSEICGFVQSAPGSGWVPLGSAVSPAAEEQGAAFVWAGMVSDRLGFVCCGYKLHPEPTVYATTDGGANWAKLSLPLPEGFDETAGYLVGSAASLEGDAVLLRAHWIAQGTQRTVTYRSEDQGVSWQLAEVGDPLSRS